MLNVQGVAVSTESFLEFNIKEIIWVLNLTQSLLIDTHYKRDWKNSSKRSKNRWS